eukprot:SAG11_NODE_19602_length_463_cov_0.848901_1_plen_150_part_10
MEDFKPHTYVLRKINDCQEYLKVIEGSYVLLSMMEENLRTIDLLDNLLCLNMATQLAHQPPFASAAIAIRRQIAQTREATTSLHNKTHHQCFRWCTLLLYQHKQLQPPVEPEQPHPHSPFARHSSDTQLPHEEGECHVSCARHSSDTQLP